MEELKYCAFIDVLGYSGLVTDTSLSTANKIKMLKSIYESLATHFLMTINDMKSSHPEEIYMRSFSDCFYLDCEKIEPLLIAIERIFDYTIGFYKNIPLSDAYTPLLRCGIVKDWIVKFRDIGAITYGTGELNPVGLAVVRAYTTSEKSRLSGMRIIISPEVMEDLNPLHLTIPDFTCYIKDIQVYPKLISRYYFKHIIKNEKSETTDLYELMWPYGRVNDHPWDCIEILTKIKRTVPQDHYRHFEETVKLYLDAFLLSDRKTKSYSNYERDRARLAALL